MPSLIEVPNLRDGYITVIEHVLKHGRRKSPRGIPTIECRDVTVVIADPTDVLPVGIGRKLNLRIAMLEAVQLIAGMTAYPDTIKRIAPSMPLFAADEDGTYWGAYGDRIEDQLWQMEDKLRHDPDTRQAVATLWNPILDNQPKHNDYPCTVALMASIDDGQLVWGTRMRSNDAWLGLAFDAFQFCQAQLTLAASLGVEAGAYHHNAWSLHIYERDLAAIEELHAPTTDGGFKFTTGIGLPGMPWSMRQDRAQQLIMGTRLVEPTPVEEAYADALK